jgi:two-component system response regulator YesN
MLKVLVVDDDHLVRRGFIAMMPWQAHNLEVVGEAGNGKKALEFLEQHRVDLLITDLAMPVMSGIDLMRQVKEQYPDVYMVVLTFHQDFELIQEALRLGALDYITKVELEHEQMDVVLRRIVNRIKEHHAASAETESHRPAISMQKLHEIGKLWSSPDWMMDEHVFQRLLAETEQLHLSASQLEQLFYVAADHWKRLFGSSAVYDDLVTGHFSWNDWVEWLQNVRSAMQDFAQPQPYSAEVKASIWKAVDLIQREIQEELHLPEMAKRVNMSRSYFSRCFRDIVGKTFNDYVREMRVEHAKVLLRQTGKTIGWIATQSGYPNEKYFCKVFRELTGMLPSEYRRRHCRQG